MTRDDWQMLALAMMGAMLVGPASAQELDGLTWAERKCGLYAEAVQDALEILGRDGIGEAFLAANDAFIDGGCTEQGHVCPKTEKEGDFVNLLTVMTMNEGMASTFVPFGCSD